MMRLPVLIVILLFHSHDLLAFSLSSRFLLPSEEKLSAHVNEVVTINKRGGGGRGGSHGGGHSGSSGGRAARGGGSRKSPNTATGVIPVYAAGAMNHHNINRSHNSSAATTLNCIFFSSLLFSICTVLIMVV